MWGVVDAEASAAVCYTLAADTVLSLGMAVVEPFAVGTRVAGTLVADSMGTSVVGTCLEALVAFVALAALVVFAMAALVAFALAALVALVASAQNA